MITIPDGDPVKIIGLRLDDKWKGGIAICEYLNDPTHRRDVPIFALFADGGLDEIHEAMIRLILHPHKIESDLGFEVN